MTYHLPPVMVAIGLLGDEAERNQSATTRWSSSHGNRHRSSTSMQSEDAAREMPGFFSWRPVRHEIRSNLPSGKMR